MSWIIDWRCGKLFNIKTIRYWYDILFIFFILPYQRSKVQKALQSLWVFNTNINIPLSSSDMTDNKIKWVCRALYHKFLSFKLWREFGKLITKNYFVFNFKTPTTNRLFFYFWYVDNKCKIWVVSLSKEEKSRSVK